MTINRTTLLDLPLPVTGTESGTWGDIVNNGLSEYIDISVAGSLSLSADSDTNLSSTEGNAAGTNIGSTTAQYAILRCTGARTATRNINAPAWAISGGTLTNYSKIYIVVNETTGSQNIVLRATNSATPTYTTGVTIVPGERAVCAWNGSDFVKVGGAAGGSTTQIQFNNAGVFGGSANLTWDGTNVQIGATGALRLADTDSSNYVAFKSPGTVASNVTWTLPSADGTNGQALTTNGSGTLAFSSVTTSPGGSTTQVQYNNAGAFGGSANFVFDGTNVGIGTSSPADKLDVRHAGVAARFTSTNGNNNQIAFSNSATAVVGFYMGSPAADVLQFSSSAGTERMRIDSSGNVGIGTSSPLARLTVSDSTATSGTMTLGNNASYNGTLQYIFSTGELRISQVGGASLGTTFYTASTERMRIDASGNVGIGVTPPTVSQGRLLSLAYSGSGISVTSGTSLDLTDNAYYNTAWKYGQNGLSARFQLTDDQFIFFNAATGTAGNNITWSERMRINASGNVGIGTSSPGYKLDVQDAIRIRIDGSNNAALYFNATSTQLLYNDSSGALSFYTNSTERMKIGYAGGVTTSASISVGGAAPGSGAGITFPATQSASSDANTLDDYEEGTWTPSLGGTASYNSREGNYVKIGKQVTVNGSINVNAIGTGSAHTVSGLPFSATINVPGSCSFFTSVTNLVTCIPQTNADTTFTLVGLTAAGASFGTQNVFQNNTIVRFSITYFV